MNYLKSNRNVEESFNFVVTNLGANPKVLDWKKETDLKPGEKKPKGAFSGKNKKTVAEPLYALVFQNMAIYECHQGLIMCVKNFQTELFHRQS